VSLLCPIEKIGEHPLVTRFLRGISKLRPPKPKYNFIWNPTDVLQYLGSLEPLSFLSFVDLTLKLVGLLALSTAHRCRTFSLIDVDQIFVFLDKIEIKIVEPIKTTKPETKQPCLVLPFFHDRPNWCAARAFLSYMEFTKQWRTSGRNRLFLGWTAAHCPVTAQTIGRWIKIVLDRAGIDLFLISSIFSAHSVRHSATSTALKRGISMDLIRDRAGWSERSSVFTRFSKLPLDHRNQFATSIITTSATS